MSSDRFSWRQWLAKQGNGATIWPSVLPARFDLAAVNVAEGLREGIGCAAPVLVGELMNQPILAWAAVAAFYTCLVDPGGAFRGRSAAMMTLGVLGATSCAVALCVFHNMWLVVGLGFVLSFCTSFARVFGDAAQKVGLFVLVAFVVASGSFDALPVRPLEAAAVFLGGALWAMLLTLGLWPVRPHGPVRRSLFIVYNRLSSYAADIVRATLAARYSADQWGVMTRRNRSEIRNALDAARSTIVNLGRTHSGRNRRIDQQLTFLQCADEIFASLIALSDLIETQGGRVLGRFPPALAVALEQTPDILKALAVSIFSPTKTLPGPVQAELCTLLELVAAAGWSSDEMPSEDDRERTCRHLITTLLSFARTAADATCPTTPPASAQIFLAQMPQAIHRSRREVVLLPLRENLSFDSIALRHSLRLAVAAAISLFVSMDFAFVHGYWLTMTVVLILQPYLGTTWQITVRRVIYSSLGGVLAAGLTFIVHSPISIALSVFPLSIATMIFRPIDYGLFVMCLTPQFVLISSLADPLHSDLRLAAARASDSFLGGILVLLVGVLLWPRQRHRELGADLAAVTSANRNYFAAILDAQRHPEASGLMYEMRRLAGLASNSAEATLERMLAEPGADAVTTEAMMTFVKAARRLTGSMTLLSLLPEEVSAKLMTEPANLRSSWLVQALETIEAAAMSSTLPKPLVQDGIAGAPVSETAPDGWGHAMTDDLLGGIATQIVVLQSAMQRLAQATAINSKESAL